MKRRGWTAALILALMTTPPVAAHAHGDAEPGWSFDPWVVIPLLTSGLLYAVGTSRLWRRAGIGRGIPAWQAISYFAGWLCLAGALVSPLHALGEHLFTAHMVEHEIIMACAAPLLALSRPVGRFSGLCRVASAAPWVWPPGAAGSACPGNSPPRHCPRRLFMAR